jgi:hypothetical protein
MEADAAHKQQVREWEGRWGKPAALVTLLGILVVTASSLALSSMLASDSDAETLREVADKSSDILLLTIARGIGFLLVPAVLLFLYFAVGARRGRMPAVVATVPVVAAVMLAIGSIFTYVAVKQASDDFIEKSAGAADPEKVADDALDNLGAAGDFAAFLPIAGLFLLGLFAALVSMWAMRTGLLTRFTGTLGMATAAFFFLLPSFPYFFFLFLIYLAFLSADWLVDRTPAWEKVEEMPWPSGGMRPDGPEPPDDGKTIDVGDPHNPPLPDPTSPGAPDAPSASDAPSSDEPPRKRKRRD